MSDGANRLGCSPKMREFANFFTKKEPFAQKTDEGLPNPVASPLL